MHVPRRLLGLLPVAPWTSTSVELPRRGRRQASNYLAVYVDCYVCVDCYRSLDCYAFLDW